MTMESSMEHNKLFENGSKLSTIRLYVGIYMMAATCAVSYIWGNLNVYVVSYFYFRVNIDMGNSSSWVLALNSMAWGIGIMTGSSISKKFGFRSAMVGSCVVFSTSMSLCYFVVKTSFILLTVLVGLVCGVTFGLSQSLATNLIVMWTDPKKLGLAICLQMVLQNCGSIVVNMILTTYVNYSNIPPDSKGETFRLFSQSAVLDNVPNMFVLFGCIVFVTGFISSILVWDKTPKTEMERNEITRDNRTDHTRDNRTDHTRDNRTDHTRDNRTDHTRDNRTDHTRDNRTDHTRDNRTDHTRDNRTDQMRLETKNVIQSPSRSYNTLQCNPPSRGGNRCQNVSGQCHTETTNIISEKPSKRESYSKYLEKSSERFVQQQKSHLNTNCDISSGIFEKDDMKTSQISSSISSTIVANASFEGVEKCKEIEKGHESINNSGTMPFVKHVLKNRNFYGMLAMSTYADVASTIVNTYFKVFGLLYYPDDQFFTRMGVWINVGTVIATYASGLACDKWHVKYVVIADTVFICLASSFLFLAVHISKWLYLILGVILVGCSLAVYVLVTVCASRYFEKRHTTLIQGMAQTSLYVTNTILPGVAYFILSTWGWLHLFSLVNIIIVIGLVIIIFGLEHKPDINGQEATKGQ